MPAPRAVADADAACPATRHLADNPYDPAEWRWVPVRRRSHRHDGWTPEKQRHFIETLADTGQVILAAKAVGMSRESAHRLARAPGGEAFAAAWDAARAHAGRALEDLAFDRVATGVEEPVFNRHGEKIGVRTRYDNRLLMFLLRHLRPERYGRDALAQPPAPPPPLDETLRAMEPVLPAPPEQLVDPSEWPHILFTAGLADGNLPQFLRDWTPERDEAADICFPEERAQFEQAIARMKAGALHACPPAAR